MGTGEPLLSASIIVRDEADFLRSCLASITEVCDEIVVVDTGSVDESVEVAREFGAVTDVRPWDGDFAAARNRALDMCTGEWILYIDADEQLEMANVQAARAELRARTDAVALRLWFRSRPIFSPYREFRLWRHRADVRFHGRIHETMVPDLRRISDGEGLVIGTTDAFRLTHYGYEGDQTRKHRRNLPMLEQRVVEFPERCYLWNHLGNVKLGLGDAEGARAAWSSGISLMRTRGLADRTDVLCYAGLGLHLIDLGIDVRDLVTEARTLAPWYRTIHWVAAVNHRRQRRYSEAIPELQALIDIGIDVIDDALAYNNDMFTHWAWDALADCRASLKRQAVDVSA